MHRYLTHLAVTLVRIPKITGTSKHLLKIDEAKAAFEQACALAPGNPDVHLQYAEFLEEFEDDPSTVDEAFANAERVSRIADRHYLTHRWCVGPHCPLPV